MLSSLYILQANATARLCWLMGAWISKSRFSSCTACEHLPGTTVPPCPLPGFKLPPRTMCKFWPVAAAGITLHRMSLFSWGPAHTASVSCDEHLPPSAYGCIPLHHSGLLCIFLHPSVSLCVPLHIWVARARCKASEQAPAPPAPPIGKQSNLREQGLLPQIRGCVRSVCSQAIHAVCPNMYF